MKFLKNRIYLIFIISLRNAFNEYELVGRVLNCLVWPEETWVVWKPHQWKTHILGFFQLKMIDLTTWSLKNFPSTTHYGWESKLQGINQIMECSQCSSVVEKLPQAKTHLVETKNPTRTAYVYPGQFELYLVWSLDHYFLHSQQ